MDLDLGGMVGGLLRALAPLLVTVGGTVLAFLVLRAVRLRRAPEVTQGVRERAGAAIRAYCGLNGSGKTLMAVRDLIPVLDGKTWTDDVSGRSGERLVWSNVRLLDEQPAQSREQAAQAWAQLGLGPCRDPLRLPHPRYRPLTEWAQFFARNSDGHWMIEHASVLLDEVTSVANSRDSGSMAREVADLLVMLRKRDCESIWTGTSFQRADVIIRETTFRATLCEGSRPDTKDVSRTGWTWAPNRKVTAKTYDVSALEEFTASQADPNLPKHRRLRAVNVERYWRPTHRAQQLYDTFDAVTVLSSSTATSSGRCIHCGGRKKVPMCEGHNGLEVIDTVARPVHELEPVGGLPPTAQASPDEPLALT
jgi:hypothetical protein